MTADSGTTQTDRPVVRVKVLIGLVSAKNKRIAPAVSVPTSCPLCGDPVWIELSSPELETSLREWMCPHCHSQNQAKIDGRILSVVKRYRMADIEP